MPSAAETLLKGDIKEIAEYEILRKLGEGGMGMVFLARQKSLDRTVALKVLSPAVAKDKKFIERFQREARATGNLNHPNIVQGIDVAQDPKTGLWHFAMEFVNGASVSRMLKSSGTIPERRALQIVRQISSALECAEKHGFVHRDIKPDNILLTAGGDAKLADLGLAKKTQDSGLTQMGEIVGTPHYISPEQARGITDLDIRTDIYSLGATLFHMVTGRPPFEGATPAVIAAKHIQEPMKPARDVNPAVSEACSKLIAKMTQKDRSQRIRTSGELSRMMDKILSDYGSSRKLEPVAPSAPAKKEHRHESHRKTNPMNIAAVAVMALFAFAVYYATSSPPPPKRPVAPPSIPSVPVAETPAPAAPVKAPDKAAPSAPAVISEPPAPDTVSNPSVTTAATDPVKTAPAVTPAAPVVSAPAPAVEPVKSMPSEGEKPSNEKDVALAEAKGKAYLAKFDEAAMAGHFDEAKKIAAEVIADPAMKPLETRIQFFYSVGMALTATEDARLKALQTLVGKPLKIQMNNGTASGVVEKVSADAIYVNVKQENVQVLQPVRWADITPSERIRLGGIYVPSTPQEHLALAIRALGQKDLATARAELATIKERLPLVRYFEKKADDLAGAAVDGEAKKAWETLHITDAVPATKKAAQDELEKINEFEKKYGHTGFAASIVPQVNAAKSAAQKMLNVVKGILVGKDQRGISIKLDGKDDVDHFMIVDPTVFQKASQTVPSNRVTIEYKESDGQKEVVSFEALIPREKEGKVSGKIVWINYNQSVVDVQPDGGGEIERYIPRWIGGERGGLDRVIIDVISKKKLNDPIKIEWMYDNRKRALKVE